MSKKTEVIKREDSVNLPTLMEVVEPFNENDESITVGLAISEKTEGAFSSCSQEIKYYFLNTLADGTEHSRKELVAALNASARVKDFSDAMIINVLRTMAKERIIINTERGKYMIVGTDYLSLTNQLLSVLKRNKVQLTVLANINYINMREEEIEVLNKVKKCIITLDETIMELEA